MNFWWLEKQNPEKGTRFDKAVTYIRNRQDLLDGRCSFSNNAGERAVKQVDDYFHYKV